MRGEGRSSGVFKASVRVVCASQLVRVHTQVEMCLEEKRGVEEITSGAGRFYRRMGVVHEEKKSGVKFWRINMIGGENELYHFCALISPHSATFVANCVDVTLVVNQTSLRCCVIHGWCSY